MNLEIKLNTNYLDANMINSSKVSLSFTLNILFVCSLFKSSKLTDLKKKIENTMSILSAQIQNELL